MDWGASINAQLRGRNEYHQPWILLLTGCIDILYRQLRASVEVIFVVPTFVCTKYGVQGWTSNESSEFEAIRIYNQRTRPTIERIFRTRDYSERITVRYERTDFYSCSLIFVRFVRYIRYGPYPAIGT